jgi:IS605 OrfB family transposase
VSIEVRRLNRRWGELKLPKLGWVRFRWSRSPVGAIGHATVSRSPLGWEASLCIEDGRAPEPLRELGPHVGVDAGVVVSFATSDGELCQVPQPRPRERERRLRLERRLARQQKGSRRRAQTKRALAKVRARQARRRQDFLHKTTTALVRTYALIAVEDLRVKQMTRSAKGTVEQPGVNVAQKAGLNRAILEQAWGEFRRQLAYKSVEHGVWLEPVPAHHTSQQCRACGHSAPESRESQALFCCVACAHSEHADIHAARNILARAQAQLGSKDLAAHAAQDPTAGQARGSAGSPLNDGREPRTTQSRPA